MAAEQEKIFNDTKDTKHCEDTKHRDDTKDAQPPKDTKDAQPPKDTKDRKEEKAAYRAANRSNNREKVREQDRARYARNREEILRRKAEKRGPPKPKKPPKFKYQAAFNKRVREEKRYYCEVCDTACSKPNELKRHFETKKHVRNSRSPKRTVGREGPEDAQPPNEP